MLVTVQWWLYRRYRKAEPAARGTPAPVLVCGALLLACYVYLLATFWRELSSWPTVGSWLTLFVALFGCGATYQVFLLLHGALRRSLPLARAKMRVPAIVCGVGMAAAIGGATQDAAMQAVVTQHAKLLQTLATSPSPCDAFHTYVSGYPDRRRVPLSLHTAPRRYVLTFRAGSVDIDGSTLVIDSARAQPWLFHNDSEEEHTALKALQKPLEECAPRPR